MNTKVLPILFLALTLFTSPLHAVLGIGEPPLALTFRPSAVGAGYVLIITNTSDEHLHQITVKAKNPNGQEFKRQVVAITLKPHRSVEVGWMEIGWQFDPGEKVYVGAKGFWSDTTTSIPKK